MRTSTLLLLVALLALALPAQATQTWTNCSGGSPANGVTVTRYDRLCLDWVTADSGDSQIFVVGTKTALLCFDPDINTEGADAAKINFRYCPNGIQPAASPENECFALSTAPITGITGAAGTQDACERVGPGTYYVEIETQGGAGDESRVTIQGEGD
jgi:hypothetical protein